MLKRLAAVLVLAVTVSGCATLGAQSPALTLSHRLRIFDSNIFPRWMGSTKGDSHVKYYDALIRAANDMGIIVIETDIPKEIGAYAPDYHLIFLHWELEGNGKVETLAHELGHAMNPKGLDVFSSEGQVFAEAVSFLYCQEIKLDNYIQSYSYLSVLGTDRSQRVIEMYHPQIDHAVRYLRSYEPH